MTLRPYQTKMLNGTIEALNAGDIVITQAPTGAGKTVVFGALAKLWVEQAGGKVLVVTHRVELRTQTAARLGDTATVVMISQAERELAKMGDGDLLIVDEAHHAAAPTWHRAIAYATDHGIAVSGWSATPSRLDGRPLGDIFTLMIDGPQPGALVADGFLAKPRLHAKANARLICGLTGISNKFDDFNIAELATLVKATLRADEIVDAYQDVCDGAQAIAFCVDVEAATAVAEAARARGIQADVLTYQQTDAQRKAVDRALRAGELKLVSTVDLVGEGYDLPAIDAVLLARPTMSLTLYLQQVGRALRPREGKAEAHIIDLVGNVARHLPPTTARLWSLHGPPKTIVNGEEIEASEMQTVSMILAASEVEEFEDDLDDSQEPQTEDGVIKLIQLARATTRALKTSIIAKPILDRLCTTFDPTATVLAAQLPDSVAREVLKIVRDKPSLIGSSTPSYKPGWVSMQVQKARVLRAALAIAYAQEITPKLAASAAKSKEYMIRYQRSQANGGGGSPIQIAQTGEIIKLLDVVA